MGCPAESVLVDLVGRVVAAEPASDLEAHLADCDDCRRLAFALAAEHASGPAGGAPDRIGRFEVIAEIGAGAMGRVYQARDPALERAVAVKVRRAGAALVGDGDERLRREGQALARLSHPNVVAVHETGVDDGASYIVMEYVEGVTLDRWVATPRPLRAVVDVLAGVARGLAAAHAVGLVHRDVKPSNILVTADGTAKIGDFGLARLEIDRAVAGVAGQPSGDLTLTLSLTGSLVGTPAYMAPEQLQGAVASERSDQFGFCVTLFEAVTGNRPFTGRTTVELVAGIARGPGSPAFDRLPARLRTVLARGLQLDPARRYPSMAALAAALVPRTTRTRWLALGGVAWLALAGAMLARPGDPASHCGVADARLARMFGAPRRALITARFAEHDLRALNEAKVVTDLLVEYGAHWQAAETASCRASGGRPSPLGDRQRACLERRLARADDLAALLTQSAADAPLFEAAHAVEALGDPSSCLRVAASAGEPDPPSAALAPIAAAFERQVDRLVNLVHTRRTAEARDVDGLAAAVRALGISSLTARVLIAKAEIDALHDRFGNLEALLEDAAREAARAHDDALVAEAWTTRVFMLRMSLGRGVEARRWLAVADAALLRAGDPPDLRARLHQVTGVLHADAGAFAEARRAMAAGIALLEGVRPTALHALAYAENLRGGVLTRAGAVAEARAAFDRSLALLRSVHVELHPDMISTLLSLGMLLAPREPRQAIEVLDKARRLTEQLMGPDHMGVARALDMEGNARMALGEYAAAEALYRRAYEIKRGRLSVKHANLAYSLCSIARAELALGSYPAALRDARECLEILTATLGPQDAMLARAHAGIGHARKHLRDRAGAIAEYRAALAIFEAGEGQGGEEAAVVRVELGRLLATAGHSAEARVQFTRAEPALRGVQGENRDYDLLALAGLVVCDAADRRVDRARLAALEDAVATRRELSPEVLGFTAFARARARAVGRGRTSL